MHLKIANQGRSISQKLMSCAESTYYTRSYATDKAGGDYPQGVSLVHMTSDSGISGSRELVVNRGLIGSYEFMNSQKFAHVGV